MNWIKSHPFATGLAGITVLICGILFSLSSGWGASYAEAKSGFDESYEAVSSAEKLPLYPADENIAGKNKAIADYRQAIVDLRELFEPYRRENTENISPQIFTDRLLSARREVSAAFGKDIELPENFHLGFEGYRSQLAKSDATGALLYQMEGIKHALMGLAAARPSALLKLHRVAVIEENAGTYQPGSNDAARHFPFEITFRGSESSVRAFLNSLGSKDNHYFIVRCLKIKNERTTPPRVSDARFETAAVENAAAAPANLFANLFNEVVVDEPAPGEPAPGEPAPGEPAPGEPAAAEEKALPADAVPAEVVDTSRILTQVLGNEDLIVFVRIDLVMFLPAKELPKP